MVGNSAVHSKSATFRLWAKVGFLHKSRPRSVVLDRKGQCSYLLCVAKEKNFSNLRSWILFYYFAGGQETRIPVPGTPCPDIGAVDWSTTEVWRPSQQHDFECCHQTTNKQEWSNSSYIYEGKSNVLFLLWCINVLPGRSLSLFHFFAFQANAARRLRVETNEDSELVYGRKIVNSQICCMSCILHVYTTNNSVSLLPELSRFIKKKTIASRKRFIY